MTSERPIGALLPAIFVLLWSTGFIGAKFGLPDADPLILLALRLSSAAVIMTGIALASGATWPRGLELRRTLIAGLLIQACYLGGVFEALDTGIPAAITALLVGLQPLVTGALSGPILGVKVRPRQWAGLALGVVGVALVMADKVSLPKGAMGGLGFALLALTGITIGTLYQKKYLTAIDARASTAVQYGSCALLFWPLVYLTGETRLNWTVNMVFSLGWMTVVLSIMTLTLFLNLIKRGSAASVVSLMYLVPPVTALEAWFFFRDPIGWLAVIGMGVVMLAVALVNRPERA